MAIGLPLPGCSDPLPSGQVIARVDGEDLTIPEFEFERDAQAGSDAMQADAPLLDAMVRRRVLAQAALERKLDQDPAYHFALRRAREELLVEALYRKFAAGQQSPAEVAVTGFIAAHPWRFERRRLIFLANTSSPEIAVPDAVIDTLSLADSPSFPVMQIGAGKTMLWQGKVFKVLHIREAPITGEVARQLAVGELRSRSAQQEAAALYRKALASGRLQYAPGYGPSGNNCLADR